MKHIYHLFIFAVGIVLGMWIGVKFPQQGKQVADTADQQAAKVQEAVSEAKIGLLNHFESEVDNRREDTKAEMDQMLKDEQQKYQNAKSSTAN